jgi:hypothetical protein
MFSLTDNKFRKTVNAEHVVLILKWPITDCDAMYVIHRSLHRLFRLFVLKCVQTFHYIKKYMCLTFSVFHLSVYWFNHVSENVQHIIVD